MKRYFIVFYSCQSKEGNYSGHVDVTTELGLYVNRKGFTSDLIAESKYKITSVIITNIIELNESDYLDWFE